MTKRWYLGAQHVSARAIDHISFFRLFVLCHDLLSSNFDSLHEAFNAMVFDGVVAVRPTQRYCAPQLAPSSGQRTVTAPQNTSTVLFPSMRLGKATLHGMSAPRRPRTRALTMDAANVPAAAGLHAEPSALRRLGSSRSVALRTGHTRWREEGKRG